MASNDDQKEYDKVKVVEYPANCVVLPRKDVIEICKALEGIKRKLEALVR